ncbi:MAG: ferredoxin [Actinomycetota bacterium]|nr:ferredoxin [Actinomycetota bacterium]
MKPVIDQDLCLGDGICEDICPEVFELREDGLAHVIDARPGEGLWVRVEKASVECPTDAIYLEEYGPEEEAAA